MKAHPAHCGVRTAWSHGHERLLDATRNCRLLGVVERAHAVAAEQRKRVVSGTKGLQAIELAGFHTGGRDDLVFVDRINHPLHRLMCTALGVRHHGSAVGIGEAAAIGEDHRAQELDQPAFPCHGQHHRVLGQAGALDLERLLQQLVPCGWRRLDTGLFEHLFVVEEGHVVGVVGQTVLLALVAHRLVAEGIGVRVVLHQLGKAVNGGDPPGFGPLGQPAVGHPHHVERRFADELGDHGVAVLRPGRIVVVDLEACTGLERRQVTLDQIDGG